MSIETKASVFFNHILEYLKETYGEDMLIEDMDFNSDVTAMMVAIKVLLEKTSDWDGDIIDFTHMLNKLAIQYAFPEVMGDETNA